MPHPVRARSSVCHNRRRALWGTGLWGGGQPCAALSQRSAARYIDIEPMGSEENRGKEHHRAATGGQSVLDG